ncbi:hypothetical protein CMEL01_03397 [Colletotrichum melonis]|uniref:Uncharacterized protein n=1 Tax=Colletotrichum melonis TaxID=1209925 RepID=A0AAI9UNT3_9PEZI|nr:hypothetical protein CMEL01_03397 [Colletotrichum melonis]
MPASIYLEPASSLNRAGCRSRCGFCTNCRPPDPDICRTAAPVSFVLRYFKMFSGPRIMGLGFGLGTDTDQRTLYVLERRTSCSHVPSVPAGKDPSVEDCAHRTQRRELKSEAYMPVLPVGNYLQNSRKRRPYPALRQYKAYPSPPPHIPGLSTKEFPRLYQVFTWFFLGKTIHDVSAGRLPVALAVGRSQVRSSDPNSAHSSYG